MTSDDKFTLITSLGLIGTLIGNAMAGRFLHRGRRKSIFIGIVISVLGAFMMQVIEYPIFTGGTMLV